MKMSETAIRPDRQPPKDATTTNHRLLVQAGFVRQLMAGVYTYLPLGLRVLRKLEDVIREEMNAIGAEELLMPMLHPSSIWKQTGAWDSVDVLFKVKSRTGKDYALGQSQEEVVTPLVKEFVQSYRDLPLAVYHIQWKFRDELRAKSGILRGREFLMKDMYSFHETQKDFDKFYEATKKAYLKAYKRLGLVAKATEASGGSFTDKVSYEFMVITDAGEDDILFCPSCDFCANVEVSKQKQHEKCPKCGKGKLNKAVASEVGNVFDLGHKYGKDFDFSYTDREGNKTHPIMGCYGWGVSRTMGVVVEKFSDDKGIIWPEAIAPFQVSLINLGETSKEAEDVYKKLMAKGIEVLWDDRDESAGVKFAEADMIGNPYRVVISGKTVKEKAVEVKKRNESESKMMTVEELLAALNG